MRTEQKRWYVLYLTSLGVFLTAVATLVFIIDPYQHFRKNSYHLCYKNEIYFNSGIAKNYTFDAIVSGSSMMQNFNLDDVQKILQYQDPIKLTYAGGHISKHHRIIDLAIAHNKVKNILLGIDLFAFNGPSKPDDTLPDYLYDESYLNDYKYLFNISNIDDAIKILRHKEGNDPRCDLNNMYQWQHQWEGRFGKEKILALWDGNRGDFNTDFKASSYTAEKLLTNFRIHLLPLVEANPKINFTLIMPPYSILTFKDIEQKQWLEHALTFRSELVRALGSYPNVQIYDFQMLKSITHDLNNYKDLSHYHQKINYWILEQIKVENYRVDERNIINNNESIRQQLSALDDNTSFWNREQIK